MFECVQVNYTDSDWSGRREHNSESRQSLLSSLALVKRLQSDHPSNVQKNTFKDIYPAPYLPLFHPGQGMQSTYLHRTSIVETVFSVRQSWSSGKYPLIEHEYDAIVV